MWVSKRELFSSQIQSVMYIHVSIGILYCALELHVLSRVSLSVLKVNFIYEKNSSRIARHDERLDGAHSHRQLHSYGSTLLNDLNSRNC